jgi:FkbM family methyltransferase
MDSKKINETVIYLHRLEHENEAIQTIEQLESDYLKNQNWNKFIKPGSVTIDIGAHSGDTLIPLIIAGSNNLKCKTKILAFEPNKVVFDTCKKNVDSNLSDLVDIKLFPFAIIDEDDKDVEFSDHGNNMCNGGIIHDNMNDHLKNMLINTPNRKSFICKGYTLNTICNTHLTEEEIKNISFIKIDTEGYDREIVISSKDFLMKYKPVIFMEWFDFYGEEDSNKLFQIIEDINYIPFNPITLEVANVKNKIWDLLLIQKDDMDNLNKTKRYYGQMEEDRFLNEHIF